MKRLLLLPILVFIFVEANAQSNRWMYLSTGIDSTVQMVDTLANDIRQLANYDGHNNVVLMWVKTALGKSSKNANLFDSTISHIAIDTINNQMEVKSVVAYKNGSVVTSNNTDYPKWTDVIPETMGEAYIRYCQALHNKKIMADLLVNSLLHDLQVAKASDKKN